MSKRSATSRAVARFRDVIARTSTDSPSNGRFGSTPPGWVAIIPAPRTPSRTGFLVIDQAHRSNCFANRGGGGVRRCVAQDFAGLRAAVVRAADDVLPAHGS